MNESFDMRLEQYAEVIVRVGLNLQAGQRLHIGGGAYSGFLEGPPPEAAPFVRLLAKKAYQAGARYVDVSYEDEGLKLIRFQNAPADSFSETSPWASEQSARYLERGDASLTFLCSDPDLLRDQDQESVQTAQEQVFHTLGPLWNLIESNRSNWLAVAVPTPGWAAAVLPGVKPEERLDRMWEIIFDMCRINQADPVAGWENHVTALAELCNYLNEKRYQALHYSGPRTDLTVGLPENHLWHSGRLESQNGVSFVANIPTEEVFTMPHRDQINGVVKATKPLSFGGSTIEGLALTFENGQVMSARADKGQGILDSLLRTDEGSRSLGEVALVPHSSPISQSGLIFQNILYDENASCHLALGNAYRFSMIDGEDMSAEAFAAAGGNQSQVHVDFMIGSGELDLDGIRSDGAREPLMRAGEWTFGQ